MTGSASDLPQVRHEPHTRWQSMALVFVCTIFGAAAQVFMKIGGTRYHGIGWSMLENWQLLVGYALYGANTLMLMLALRHGELSKLYPIIALTFIWVNILSAIVFGEHMNVWKIAGITAIMAGVAVLGRAGSGREDAA